MLLAMYVAMAIGRRWPFCLQQRRDIDERVEAGDGVSEDERDLAWTQAPKPTLTKLILIFVMAN